MECPKCNRENPEDANFCNRQIKDFGSIDPRALPDTTTFWAVNCLL